MKDRLLRVISFSSADTTAPMVSVTAPTGTVSGTVSLSATASDNVGVVGVQFLVDNIAVGAEDTSSPYGVSFNTTTVTNGVHTVTARARDAAGNTTTSTPVTRHRRQRHHAQSADGSTHAAGAQSIHWRDNGVDQRVGCVRQHVVVHGDRRTGEWDGESESDDGCIQVHTDTGGAVCGRYDHGRGFRQFHGGVSDGPDVTPVTVKVAALPARILDRHIGADRCNPDGDGGFADQELCGQSGL